MKGIFIIVLNKDFICCPLGPSFLTYKMKGLDNIFLKHHFISILWAYLHIKKKFLAVQLHSHSLHLSPVTQDNSEGAN